MATDDLKHPLKRSQFNAYNFLVCFLISLGQIALSIQLVSLVPHCTSHSMDGLIVFSTDFYTQSRTTIPRIHRLS
jgi:hypothetical protein